MSTLRATFGRVSQMTWRANKEPTLLIGIDNVGLPLGDTLSAS